MEKRPMTNDFTHIIYFDGVCNLCNSSVQFVLKRDKKKVFRFATLQGNHAKSTFAKFSLPHADLSSIVLLEHNTVYTQSTAALRIAKKLNALWPLLYLFIIIPKPIRDAVYNYIAKNRYKWFGKQESCMLPTKETQRLFLD